MYITREELDKFRIALEYENNHHRDRNEVIDEFIEEQVAEEVSISELL